MTVLVSLVGYAQHFLQTRRNLYFMLSYALANILPGMASFVLVLIYATTFSVGDFGRYSLFTAMVMLVGIGIELGMPNGLMRDYYDRHRDKIATSYLASAIWSYRMVSLATVPFAALIVYLFWPLRDITVWITVLTVVLVAFIAYFERLAEMLGSVSRGIEEPSYFVLGRAVSAICTLIAAAGFVVGLQGGVLGALSARLLGVVVTCEVYRRVMARGAGISGGKFSWVQVRSYLRFGLPLMPNRFAVWAQQNGLKPILTPILPLTSLGFFSLAGTIAFMPLMASSVIDLVLGPIYFKRRVDGEAVFHAKLRKLAVVMLAGEFVMLTGLILFAREAVHIIGGVRYAAAAPACALLASATLLRSMTSFFARQILYARKTWLMPAITIPGASLAVLLAIVLSSRIGFMGAAWAVVLSEAALLTGYAVVVRRIEEVQAPFGMMVGLFVVLLSLALFVGSGNFPRGLAGAIGVRLAIFTAVIGISCGIWIRPNITFLRTVLAR